METNIQIKHIQTFPDDREIECGYLENDGDYYVGEYEFRVQDEMYLEVNFPTTKGMLFAKRGCAISWDDATFEYVPFDVNGGSMMAQLGHLIKRKLAGENIGIMQIVGQGKIYLAENANHVRVEVLEEGDIFTVESENILMFNELCHYDTSLFLEGTISQGGLFITTLTAKRTGATVAIQGRGNILRRITPCKVDPDAIIAWSGPNPKIELGKTAMSIKTAVGMTSGESYSLVFSEPGHVVYMQAQERTSGVDLGIDNKKGRKQQKAMEDSNALGNSMESITDLLTSAGVDPKQVLGNTDTKSIIGLVGGLLGRR